MNVFIISLVVAVISAIFSARIVRRVTDRLAPAPDAPATLDRSPEVVRQTLAHALDVASAFPSSILTLIAIATYLPAGELTYASMVIAAVGITMFFFWFSSPKRAPSYHRWSRWKAKRYDPRRIGLLNLIIIATNIGGLILAILWPLAD